MLGRDSKNGCHFCYIIILLYFQRYALIFDDIYFIIVCIQVSEHESSACRVSLVVGIVSTIKSHDPRWYREY